MSIKKSQAILKCFINLKYSVWFTLGSEDETMHVLWHLEFFSARLPVKVFKTLNDRQSYILSKFRKSRKSSSSELSYVDKEKSAKRLVDAGLRKRNHVLWH